MGKSEEIKACPFCGYEPTKYKNVPKVKCENGECPLYDIAIDIKDWNKRAGEKLRKLLSLAITEMVQAVKVRTAFIGHPKEPMNSGGTCWANEIKMLDALEELSKSME